MTIIDNINTGKHILNTNSKHRQYRAIVAAETIIIKN